MPVATRPRGFTRLEVVVILTVVALEITLLVLWSSGPNGRGAWPPGKANVGLLNSAMKVLVAENDGRIPESAYDDEKPVDWVALDLVAEEFESDTFRISDYRVTIIDRDAPAWQISVTSSSARLSGSYVIDQDGIVLQDAP